MVDNENPTNQFHSYSPTDVTPHSEKATSGWRSMISRSGLADAIGKVDMKGGVERARSYARANPSKVLGGLAVAIIGAGLLSSRGMRGGMRRS